VKSFDVGGARRAREKGEKLDDIGVDRVGLIDEVHHEKWKEENRREKKMRNGKWNMEKKFLMISSTNNRFNQIDCLVNG